MIRFERRCPAATTVRNRGEGVTNARMRDEIEESNRHFREAWKLFARASPQGEAFDGDGWSIANACQPWFFMNVGVLRGPVVDALDLQRRARQATAYFAARSNPWVLTASEDWFGENATSVLADVGLAYKLDLMGMATERIRPPTRPLPDVQLRRIDDEENRFALADLNADSYSVPREWGRQALGGAGLWESAIFGTIACVRDEPASGAFALLVDDALYIGGVATAKTHRGRGFAELVIRKCLEDASNATGLERTVLHATGDGQSVYQRMGYRCVVRFPFYAPSH
jgi:ribosomal protein S18 acetylase RimI-like enzyme